MTPGSMGWSLFEAEARGEIPADSTTMLIWNYIGPAFDTTINGIGSTVWALARDPEQWKILKDEPALIPSAFNEGLRMETPISIWARGCRNGAEIDGVTIPPGSRMCVLIASANRDERHYPDPDRYDVRRDPTTTSPSATASTPASGRRWPAPRPTPCSPPSSTRSRRWAAASPSGNPTAPPGASPACR